MSSTNPVEMTDIQRMRANRLFRLVSGESSAITRLQLEQFITSIPGLSDPLKPLLSSLEAQSAPISNEVFVSFLQTLAPTVLSEVLAHSVGSGGRTFVSGSSRSGTSGHHSYEESEKNAVAQYVALYFFF